MLLRPIKKAGTLLLELVGVDGMIIGLLLTGSRARVVWPLLRVTKDISKLLGCQDPGGLLAGC